MHSKPPKSLNYYIKYTITCLLVFIIICFLYVNYGTNLFQLDVPKNSSMYYLIHLDWKGYANAYTATLTTIIIPLLLIGLALFLLSRIINGRLKKMLLKVMPIIIFSALFALIFIPLLFVLNVTHFSFIATFLSFLALSKPAMVKMYHFSRKSVSEINQPISLEELKEKESNNQK
ncbi:hypothetical protein CD149_09515 [Staphylococcus condimenti]|uniref:Uncharacterized protein n=6 Tax=Staphylococcus TaxID=1279 RepID=A0AB37HA46_9STAP|nr:hypothetical protein A4G25_00545 [Staphylococcus condimenti]OFO98864.1 hypothetical protein HMPREF3007_00170 [Staphylococcus sp. HMSC065E08]APR60721.1 hypothetical protein BTZ13_05785 [Staphylococcus condimenti]PNZ58945.1 hypothetical protein CD149_09515 [Staphylococcus condimenti]QQS83720.1 hypothetical protein I6J05_05190 [Staphylococcus condimenti]